jgi:hypothetical protein
LKLHDTLFGRGCGNRPKFAVRPHAADLAALARHTRAEAALPLVTGTARDALGGLVPSQATSDSARAVGNRHEGHGYIHRWKS